MSAVEKATAEVQRLAAAELSLSEKRHALVAALREAEDAAGAAALEAELEGTGDAGATIARVGQVRGELAALDSAIQKARSARLEAIPRIWQAEAAELRQEAHRLAQEADKREPKTAKLLQELREWEGCEYAPADTGHRGGGLSGNQAGGAPTVVFVTVPKTVHLRQQAAALEQQARAREAKKPVREGGVHAESREELVQAIMADPMRIGPLLPEVSEWAEEGERKERARRERLTHPDMEGFGDRDKPIDFSVVWKDGRFDPARSRVGTAA